MFAVSRLGARRMGKALEKPIMCVRPGSHDDCFGSRCVAMGFARAQPILRIYEISLSINLNPHPICARSVLGG